MTDNDGADPHGEYRRQAAQHFGRPDIAQSRDVTDPHGTPQVASEQSTAPRIFRPSEAATEQIAAAPDADATPVDSTPAPNAVAALDESTQRFGAGTVYTGRGTGKGVPPQAAVRPMEQVQSILKVTPVAQVPPRPAPPMVAPELSSAPASASPTADSGIPKWASGIPNVNVYVALTMVLAVIFPPLAIPVGHVTRTQVMASGEQGESWVRGALVLAYVSLGIFMILLVISGIAAMV